MSDPQQIEKDLREYLAQEPNLRNADKLRYLQAIFEKYLEISKLEHVVNKGDLYEITSMAKNRFSNQKLPMFITRKAVEPEEFRNIAVMEAFINYLNGRHLLKRLIKFDYTD